MVFDSPLLPGVLLRRYKRFLADVELDGGERVVAHTANTGAMSGCAQPGSRVWLSRSHNPKRKCAYTWELVQDENGTIIGINTLRANDLVAEAVNSGRFALLQGYGSVRREVRYGLENSRIDLLLESSLRPPCYIEVKNVTLAVNGAACFPDAVSTRGQKHLRELANVVQAGNRALLVFCIQRNDVREFRPADWIDRDYGELLRRVYRLGVDVAALRADPDSGGIQLTERLPVRLERVNNGQ